LSVSSVYPHLLAKELPEVTVLGAMMLDESALYRVIGELEADDFNLPSHQTIYRAMRKLLDADRGVDPITLAEQLRTTMELEAIGGPAYLAFLTEGIPRRLNLDSYLASVKNTAQLTRLAHIGEELALEATAGTSDWLDTASHHQGRLEAILSGIDADYDPAVKSATLALLNMIATQRTQYGLLGLSYGIGALDEATGGAAEGEVTVIGARSGIGKTRTMLQMLFHNASHGVPCHVFSIEMPRSVLMRAMWALQSGIPWWKVKDPRRMNDTEYWQLKQAAGVVSEWPLYIHEQTDWTAEKMAAAARSTQKRHGTRLVCLDYIQKIAGDDSRDSARIAKASTMLTNLAKNTGLHLLMLSQIRRKDAMGNEKPPTLSDLRESSQIENDAHAVVLLHRVWDEDSNSHSSLTQFIIPKQRSGATCAFEGHFDTQHLTFK